MKRKTTISIKQRSLHLGCGKNEGRILPQHSSKERYERKREKKEVFNSIPEIKLDEDDENLLHF